MCIYGMTHVSLAIIFQAAPYVVHVPLTHALRANVGPAG